MNDKQIKHDLTNHVVKLKTILELIDQADLPMSKEEVLEEVQKSLRNIEHLYQILLR